MPAGERLHASATAERRGPDRIAVLDVLRGLAILGTFASNVWLFAHPGGPQAWVAQGFDGGLDGFAAQVETALRFLANGKFLALLTVLFGVGMELQYRSAVRRGLRWPGRYLRRAFVLCLEGAVHYVLVFEFDVLMGYALTSVVVAYLIGRSRRVQTAWMAAVGISGALVLLAVTALLVSAPATAGPVPVAVPQTYLGQVHARLTQWGVFRAEILLIVPSGIVMFLLGVRLLRAGVFAPAPNRLRRRLVVLGVVAIPVNLATSFAGPALFLVDRYLVAPVVALGLLAAVVEVVHRLREAGLLCRALGAVGRTALSCYVLGNVVASVLCQPWGLDLAGRLADARPWWVPLLWLGISALLTAFATSWLCRAQRGPLELLAHRFVAGRRGRPQVPRPPASA